MPNTPTTYVSCSRCGSLIGKTSDAQEIPKIQREHIAECQIDN